MKIIKLENKIAYIILTFSIFLLAIKNLSLTSIILGSIIAIPIILLLERINLYKFKLAKISIFFISLYLEFVFLNKITYFINSNILKDYSNIIITITFLLLIIYLGNKGYHTIIKVLILATYFLILINILGFVATSFYININNIELITSNSLFKDTLYEIFILVYSYILIFKITKTSFKIKYLLFASIYQIINYLLIISILGKTLIKIYEFPFIVIFKKASLIGIIERIEIIFSLYYLFYFFFLIVFIYYQIRYILNRKIKKDKKLNLSLFIINIFIFILMLIF